MKYYCIACCVLLAVASAAVAQMDASLGGYSAMEIQAGRMKGNFATGAIEEMTGGVRIRLLSEDPGLASLPIEADSMKFSWAEGRTTPSVIMMEGKVKVSHPDASVTAEKADWDFDSGELVFTGNPVVNSERLKGLRGERMVLNLKNNTVEVTQMRADEVPLQTQEPTGPAAAPSAFHDQDVRDWTRLIDTLKSEAQADGDTPGKQILAQMSAQNRQLLTTLDTAMLVERKSDMLRLINGALTNPGLYRQSAWDGVEIPEEARALLGEASLSAPDQARLNRLLIEAAYPFAFAGGQ